MKTDLEVEVELDLRLLGKVIIFRDKHTNRTFLLYIDPIIITFDGGGGQGRNKQKRDIRGVTTDLLDV